MAKRDHIDRFLEQLAPIEGMDYDVEGIVERITGIAKRINRGMESTLAEFDLTLGEWKVLGMLRNQGVTRCDTPGALAAGLELSSGAMTNRIDRLEEAGLVRRVADPDDRRKVVVELTDEGNAAYEGAVSAQARKEQFFASALTKPEQERLNVLLRKLMRAFETGERR